MGLNVSVFRSSLGDCTLNGISSKANDLCLVNVDGPFTPDERHPAAMLVKGRGRGIARVVPAKLVNGEWVEDTRWFMNGGNIASTSDSRFGEAIAKLVGEQFRFYGGGVPIHDRCETAEQMDRLSR